jgi:glycosyltransferase involved in cell wall biosynthesis
MTQHPDGSSQAQARRSIAFLQYAGDYAEAYRRLDGGGPETYYAQRYSLEVVSALVGATTAVTTICCTAERDEDEVLPNGVRVINMRAPSGVDEARVWDALKSCKPTHVCFRTPLRGVLRQALGDDSIQSVLLTLADSFQYRGLRGQVQKWRLRRLLNHRKVVAIGNHGRNSSESLRSVGVDADRIIPWDWPHSISPHQHVPKQAPDRSNWKLLFIGVLAESKGIGDVIRAVRVLKDRGTIVQLSYAGRGDAERFARLADELGVQEQINCLGSVAHSAVVPLMRDADLIIVPSRHDYPEGFPMTIYEALSSRTPIIASDHPMYARHLGDSRAAVVYPAGQPEALAAAISSVMSDPTLYRSLSEASAASWDKLQLPVSWGSLVQAWADLGPGQPFELLKFALRPAHSSRAPDGSVP